MSKTKITYPKPDDIQAWFTKHGSTMKVIEGDSRETTFVSADGTERLSVEVSYEEGCPTCGGAYVKEWSLMVTK